MPEALSQDARLRPKLPVTGGVASVIYGEPRFTRYVDLIIHRDPALRADVYLLGDDPLHAWAFDRRVRIPLGLEKEAKGHPSHFLQKSSMVL